MRFGYPSGSLTVVIAAERTEAAWIACWQITILAVLLMPTLERVFGWIHQAKKQCGSAAAGGKVGAESMLDFGPVDQPAHQRVTHLDQDVR